MQWVAMRTKIDNLYGKGSEYRKMHGDAAADAKIAELNNVMLEKDFTIDANGQLVNKSGSKEGEVNFGAMTRILESVNSAFPEMRNSNVTINGEREVVIKSNKEINDKVETMSDNTSTQKQQKMNAQNLVNLDKTLEEGGDIKFKKKELLNQM